MEIDGDKIWFDLCDDRDTAKDHCRTYLHDYVEYSVRSCAWLGPEEFRVVRTVNSASTVMALWKTLVLNADNTILMQKRREDPTNKNKWRLRWDAGKLTQGPVYEISKVGFSRTRCLLASWKL